MGSQIGIPILNMGLWIENGYDPNWMIGQIYRWIKTWILDNLVGIPIYGSVRESDLWITIKNGYHKIDGFIKT